MSASTDSRTYASTASSPAFVGFFDQYDTRTRELIFTHTLEAWAVGQLTSVVDLCKLRMQLSPDPLYGPFVRLFPLLLVEKSDEARTDMLRKIACKVLAAGAPLSDDAASKRALVNTNKT